MIVVGIKNNNKKNDPNFCWLPNISSVEPTVMQKIAEIKRKGAKFGGIP